MAKIKPFHTLVQEYPTSHREVYHDQSECKFGKAIKSEHKQEGTGGKKLCSECARLA